MNNKKNKKQLKIEKKKFQIEKKKLEKRVNWAEHTNKKIQQKKPKFHEASPSKEESRSVWFSKKPSEISRKVRLDTWYKITNLVLYKNDEPIKVYSDVHLSAYSIGNWDEVRVGETQEEWLEYFEKAKESLISLPLLYAILEAAYDNKEKNSDAKRLLKSLRGEFEHYLCTSTRLNHSANKIFHDREAKDQIELALNIPKIGLSRRKELSELVKDPAWEETLKAMFMTKDIEKIPEVIMDIFNKKTELLLLSDPERYGQKAVSVGFGMGNFVIYCNQDYFSSDKGYARYVIKTEDQ